MLVPQPWRLILISIVSQITPPSLIWKDLRSLTLLLLESQFFYIYGFNTQQCFLLATKGCVCMCVHIHEWNQTTRLIKRSLSLSQALTWPADGAPKTQVLAFHLMHRKTSTHSSLPCLLFLSFYPLSLWPHVLPLSPYPYKDLLSLTCKRWLAHIAPGWCQRSDEEHVEH